MPNTADLIEEIAALKAMLIAADARDLRKDKRIERLEKLVAAFKHAAFGRRSEKSDPDQFELALEDLETAIAAIHAEEDAEDRAAKRPAKPRATNRGALPKHLARIEEVIEPVSLTCVCGGCLHCIGALGLSPGSFVEYDGQNVDWLYFLAAGDVLRLGGLPDWQGNQADISAMAVEYQRALGTAIAYTLCPSCLTTPNEGGVMTLPLRVLPLCAWVYVMT